MGFFWLAENCKIWLTVFPDAPWKIYIFRTTLYSHIIVEYTLWNYNFMLETHDFFSKFVEFTSLEFTSLNMLITKNFLHFSHNLISRTKIIYPEVNNHGRIKIRKLYSWKDDKHWGWTGNKFYLINTLKQEIFSPLISYSTVQWKGMTINHHSNFCCPTFLWLSR